MKERILVLVKAGLVGGAFLTLSAFSVQVEYEGCRGARETRCTSNLKQIGMMAEIYRRDFGGPNYEVPSEAGVRWHWKLIRTVSENQDTSLWQCPTEGRPDTVPDYRGPAPRFGIRQYLSTDPIAGDKLDNHGDGAKHGVYALTKGYQVFKITTGDASRWQEYLLGTSE